MLSFCWYDIFLDAYTYSTRYLLFTITLIIISILWVWIYEKPRFYKLIFKRSKHSDIIVDTPQPSAETFDINYNGTVEPEIPDLLEEKKLTEIEEESVISKFPYAREIPGSNTANCVTDVRVLLAQTLNWKR